MEYIQILACLEHAHSFLLNSWLLVFIVLLPLFIEEDLVLSILMIIFSLSIEKGTLLTKVEGIPYKFNVAILSQIYIFIFSNAIKLYISLRMLYVWETTDLLSTLDKFYNSPENFSKQSLSLSLIILLFTVYNLIILFIFGFVYPFLSDSQIKEFRETRRFLLHMK